MTANLLRFYRNGVHPGKLLLMNSAFLQMCRQICDVLLMSKSTSYHPIAFNSNFLHKALKKKANLSTLFLDHHHMTGKVSLIATF